MKKVVKIGCIGLAGFAVGVACALHGAIKYLDKMSDEAIDLDDLDDEFFCDDLKEEKEKD